MDTPYTSLHDRALPLITAVYPTQAEAEAAIIRMTEREPGEDWERDLEVAHIQEEG